MPEVPGAETFRGSAQVYDRHVGRYGAALVSALVSAATVRAGAACVWDYAGEMTLLRRFWDAAAALDLLDQRMARTLAPTPGWAWSGPAVNVASIRIHIPGIGR